MYTRYQALTQVGICRPPPFPHQFYSYFLWQMRTVLNRIKNKYSDLCDFYFLSHGWLYLQFTKNFPTKKKMFRSDPIYWKDADYPENDFLVHDYFFCATLIFWDIVNSSNDCDVIVTSKHQWCLSQKMHNVMIWIIVFMRIFCAILSFEVIVVFLFYSS